MMDEKNKKLLSKSSDRISFLYIEKARIEQTDYSVEILQGDIRYEIPIAQINCLLLGPGVSITHRAVSIIAEAGCSICWMGSYGSVFYASAEPLTRSAKNILIQMKYHENTMLHLKVIHKMYEIRYPGKHLKSKSIDILRGMEGQSVKETYETEAKRWGIQWDGRSYNVDDWESQDDVNKYITSLNQCLYAITRSIISGMGFSTAIGFIHTGKMMSFVYDISDLYKEKYIIPLAFKLAAVNNSFHRESMLREFRELIIKQEIMRTIVKDIKTLFEQTNSDDLEDSELYLWDNKKFIKSGKNYSTNG